MDLKKSGGNFLSVNSFPPKLKRYVLDLSVLFLFTAQQFKKSKSGPSFQRVQIGNDCSKKQKKNYGSSHPIILRYFIFPMSLGIFRRRRDIPSKGTLTCIRVGLVRSGASCARPLQGTVWPSYRAHRPIEIFGFSMIGRKQKAQLNLSVILQSPVQLIPCLFLRGVGKLE